MIPSSDIRNQFVREYIANNNLEISLADQEKPWGGYYVYLQLAAEDKKILWIKPQQILSLQYHGSSEHPGHSEVCQAITPMRLFLGTRSVIGISQEELHVELNNLQIINLNPGETASIPAGFLHAYFNPYDTDTYLLETRTSPTPEGSEQREANISRVYDQAGRGGLPQYPLELLRRGYQLEISSL